MIFIVLLPLGVIAIRDLYTHRISHLHLVLLGLCAALTVDFSKFDLKVHLYAMTAVGVIGLLLSFFCGLGMGDVKLLVLLALLIVPPTFDSYQIFLFALIVAAAIHSLILARGKGSLSVQIPLAPAIFIGTIASLVAK
jgi:leader peptidase (prepilin peptidase)/N-methyltransferase